MKLEQHRKEVIRYWRAKAEESLKAAEREFNTDSFGYAMNRIYYAAFYAESSALLKQQISFKKHSAVRAAFHRELVKPGFIEISWGKFYDQLFEDRQEGDYLVLVEFERKYVEASLKLVKNSFLLLKKHFDLMK